MDGDSAAILEERAGHRVARRVARHAPCYSDHIEIVHKGLLALYRRGDARRLQYPRLIQAAASLRTTRHQVRRSRSRQSQASPPGTAFHDAPKAATTHERAVIEMAWARLDGITAEDLPKGLPPVDR